MSSWSDLGPRVASAVVMAAVGVAAIWAGGLIFGALVAVAVGVVAWEVARMLAPEDEGLALAAGTFSAVLLMAAHFVSLLYVLVLIALTAVSFAMRLSGGARLRLGLYLGWVLLAGFGLIALRARGAGDLLWLVAVVVATDTAGYFAGRLIGGPRFWPAVSPKKTWAGTVAGWLAAALVGLAFGGAGLALVSALLSFASQMGDAAESALKRHAGVKDSSALIPGHGGVFDRFDALLGASLVLFVIGVFA